MKKKTILATGLTISLLLSSAMGMAGCGEEPHTHSIGAVAKKDAGCTEAGYEAYYKCSGCDKIFSDEKGETEITAPEVIPAAHKVEAVAKVDATCTAEGTAAHYKCSVCDTLFSDEEGKTVIEAATAIPVVAHTIVEVPKKRPTCTETGYEEHFKCSVCDALFADEEGKTAIEAATVIPEEHRLVAVEEKKPTCLEAGYEAHYKCSLCDKLFSDNAGTTPIEKPVAIPVSTEHSIGFGFTKDTVPAPVVEGGTLETKCTVCGKAGETINYLAGFSMDKVTNKTALKMETAGNYYITLASGGTNSRFAFHATKAGTYKLTFTEVFSQETLTRMFAGIWIKEDAYATSPTGNLWSTTDNDWSTTDSLQPIINKYKDKIVRDETTADYSSLLGPRTTLNTITFTLAEEDIPENGLFITLQLGDKVLGEDGKVANPTEAGTYLIKYETPEE